MRRVAAIVAAQLIASILAPGTVASAEAGRSCYRIKDDERAFARKVNASRSNRDKGRLRLDPELSRVARRHTREMVKKGVLFHQTSAQFDHRITNWSMIAENVAYGSAVGQIHKMFMNSPLHAANILNPSYRFVGAGVVTDDGRMWVTVIFEARSNPGTRLKMPSC
ncbi:MAG: CAP domain-containing protein [Actinomycetota bacterium]